MSDMKKFEQETGTGDAVPSTGDEQIVFPQADDSHAEDATDAAVAENGAVEEPESAEATDETVNDHEPADACETAAEPEIEEGGIEAEPEAGDEPGTGEPGTNGEEATSEEDAATEANEEPAQQEKSEPSDWDDVYNDGMYGDTVKEDRSGSRGDNAPESDAQKYNYNDAKGYTAESNAAGSAYPESTERNDYDGGETYAQRTSRGFGIGLVGGLLGGCIATLCGLGLLVGMGYVIPGKTAQQQATQSTVATTEKEAVADKVAKETYTLAQTVSEKALPSVVSVNVVYTQSGGASFFDLFSDFGTGTQTSSVMGSGVVYDKEGHIITNAHVIADADAVTVAMNGKEYDAEIIGSDSSSDLAVLKLKDAPESEIVPIEIGDSSSLKVGEWVMTAGAPFGQEQSVSSGIVSGLYRDIAMSDSSGVSIYADTIQTDAAINPGNSGGALLNSDGQLVGINSLFESYSGSSAGVGFAIPSNYVVSIANQLIEKGNASHPYIGASLITINSSNARANGLLIDYGAYVAEVEKGGPADKAGIEKGDILIGLDGEDVTTADGMIIAIRSHKIGDTAEIKYLRSGKEQTTSITFGDDSARNAGDDSEVGNGAAEQDTGRRNGFQQDTQFDQQDVMDFFEKMTGDRGL